MRKNTIGKNNQKNRKNTQNLEKILLKNMVLTYIGLKNWENTGKILRKSRKIIKLGKILQKNRRGKNASET